MQDSGFRIQDSESEARKSEARNEGSTVNPQTSLFEADPSSLNPESRILNPEVRFLGLVEYQPTFEAMKQFTAQRKADTCDEIWLLQHPSVYTQGQAGKPEHLLNPNDIPVVQIDRGGQITYHGPGQIVMYLLLDLRRWKLNVRQLVRLMEQSVIDLLAAHGVEAHGREDAPGVYVGDAKIAALGLKIKKGCCYHGLSFNVDMDLAPFANINPCGYAGLRVTQARDLGITVPEQELEQQLAENLLTLLQQGKKQHEQHC
jgi:lipoyl(octanoyl) transferase